MAKGLGSISWQDLLSALREEAVVVGPDYAILYANQPLLERLGLSASQVVGQPCHRAIHGKGSPCYESGEECPVRQVIETGRPASVIHRHTRTEGYRHYLEIEAHPLRDAKGKLAAVLCLARELGLAERYQRIFEATREGVAVVSRSGRLVDANPALCRMLGYSKEELGRMKTTDFVPPEVASAWRDAPQDSPYVEMDLPRKDGSPLAVEAAVSTLPLGPVTLYVAFVRDITGRKQWEETITQQAQALARSEAQYRTLFESAGGPLAVIEADGVVSLVNARFEEFMGYSKEEVEGRLTVADLVLEEDLEQVLRVRQRRLAGTPITHHLNRIRCKDGTLKLLAVTGVLIPGSQRSFVSFRDVTEAHRLERELLGRNRELEALYAVAALLSRSADMDAMLGRVLDKVLELTGQSRGFLYLLDEEQRKLFIRVHRGASARALKEVDGLALGAGFGGRVAQTGDPLFTSDIASYPRHTHFVAIKEGFKTLACVPLVSGGRVLGVMTLLGRESREFPPEERLLLVSLGNEIGAAVERAQLLQRARDRAQELEALYAVAALLSRSADPDRVLPELLQKVVHVMGLDGGLLYLLDEGQQRLFIKAHYRSSEKLRRGVDGLELGEGFGGRVAQTGEPLFIPDIANDPRLTRPVALEEGGKAVACVPLVSGGRVLGAMNLGGKEVREFSQGERRLLVSLGNEIGVAVERAQLWQRARDRAQELEAFYAVAALLSRSADMDAMLGQVLETALKLTGLSGGLIFLLDEEQQKLFIRAHKKSSQRLRNGVDGLVLGEGFGGRVAQTGEALFIPDISKDPRLTRTVALQEGFKSLACVPLVSGGRVLGVMTLTGKEVRDFSPEEQRLLTSLGNEIGVAAERAQLWQRARDRAQELESLMSVSREMTSTLDLEAVLNRTLAIMCRQVGAGHGFLCLLDQEKGELTAAAFHGERVPEPGRVWKMGEGIVGWVAQHQGPLVSNDIATDPRIQGSHALAQGYTSAAAVPLKAKDKLLGVVVVASRERTTFTGAHLRLLTAYAAEASMALENALLHQEVRRQAATDDLTRLANRRHLYLRLEEELKRAQRYGHTLSLLFLDVNDLKAINDQYGHLQGDELLRHLAALLTRVLRGTDLAARYGGDEFVVLLPETSREEATNVVERLLQEATPCPLPSGGSIPWRMSVGVAWAPVEGDYEVDLLRLADEAAYRAKREGAGWAFARVG